MMRRRIAHVALLLALPALGLPAPAQAQRWDGLEDALEGRELNLRPTIEGSR